MVIVGLFGTTTIKLRIYRHKKAAQVLCSVQSHIGEKRKTSFHSHENYLKRKRPMSDDFARKKVRTAEAGVGRCGQAPK